MNDHTYENYQKENQEVEDTYAPTYSPRWERLIGPGALGASIVAVILAILAMIITYHDPEPQTFVVRPAPKPIDPIKDDPTPLVTKQPDIKVTNDTHSIIVPKVEITKEQTSDNEDFVKAKGDPSNKAMTDFDNKNKLTTLGRGGGAAGRPGQNKGGRIPGGEDEGGREAYNAVIEALRWLRRHQNSDGSWSTEGYTHRCGREGKRGRCSGHGESHFDHGATALSLLAYTGLGLDHNVAESEFKNSIVKAMNFLIKIQKKDGCFGEATGEHLYNQSLCTFALADLLAMSGDHDKLRKPVELGVAYLLAAQNDNEGGAWRYNNYKTHPEARDELDDGIINDTSVTTWVVMALKTAKACGIQVDDKGFVGAQAWLDHCYREREESKYNTFGTYAYNMQNVDGQLKQTFAYSRPYATTACGVLSRQFMKQSDHPSVIPCIKTLATSLPNWHGERDLYYWYYGSLAMRQVYDEAWEREERYWNKWNIAMKEALLKNQQRQNSICLFGSWDPEGTVWGDDIGGRVYTTAIAALTLEVYYRYGKQSDKEKAEEVNDMTFTKNK